MFTPEQLLALGIYTKRGNRDHTLREFLLGVVQRQEPHYTMAVSALNTRSNGRTELHRATQQFLNPTPDIMVLRVGEMCADDPDMCREAILRLKESAHNERRRALVLTEQVNSMRERCAVGIKNK
jgi:hypothetical protein